MAAPVGIGLASFVHVTLAVVGAGTVIARSPTSFQTLKLAGAGYLGWLGIKQWTSESSPLAVGTGGKARADTFELLRRGFVVSLTNPKAILQYVAVLPQFIDISKPTTSQVVVLALVAAPVVVADYAIYTAAASGIARRLTVTRMHALRRATGTIHVVAAVVLAVR